MTIQRTDITPSWWTDATPHEQASALESLLGRLQTYRGAAKFEIGISLTEVTTIWSSADDVQGGYQLADQLQQALEAEGACVRERQLITNAKRDQLDSLAAIYDVYTCKLLSGAKLTDERLRAVVALAMVEAELTTQWKMRLVDLKSWVVDSGGALIARGRSRWSPFEQAENS